MLDQWKTLWTNLTVRQRITIGLAIAVVAMALTGLTRWRTESDFRPLYTGMSAEDAGAVVAKLKESGVEYRVSDDGTTVLAPSARLAEVRLEMASAGLPKTGRIGFELFDKANLGMTDFAEQVNYRRALEGELERSVRAISEVEQARVHITFPKDSVFLESRTPGKASVLLKLKPGAQLTPQNVAGITHMVASAADGLSPDAVSVMDVHGTLLNRPKSSQDASDLSDEAMEHRRRLERDMLAKINATLEPLLGSEKFRAGVSVDLDFSSGEQSEELYDPERSVMATSQKTEETTSSLSGAGGVPGTASSLPRADARTAGRGVGVSRRSETIAFQTSKTVRRIKIPQGNVKRVSASVLVDQAVTWEGSGKEQRKVVTPPSAETVRAIRVLVSGAIGLQPDRGDQLVVESLPFESTMQLAPPLQEAPKAPESQPWTAWDIDPRYIAAGAAGLVILLLSAGFLVRRARRRRVKVSVGAALPGGADAAGALAAGQDDGNPKEIPPAEVEEARFSIQAARMERLVGSVKKAVSDDPVLVAGVIRTWLEDRER